MLTDKQIEKLFEFFVNYKTDENNTEATTTEYEGFRIFNIKRNNIRWLK